MCKIAKEKNVHRSFQKCSILPRKKYQVCFSVQCLYSCPSSPVYTSAELTVRVKMWGARRGRWREGRGRRQVEREKEGIGVGPGKVGIAEVRAGRQQDPEGLEIRRGRHFDFFFFFTAILLCILSRLLYECILWLTL